MSETTLTTIPAAAVLESKVPEFPLVEQAKKLPFTTHDEVAYAKEVREKLKIHRAFIMDDENGLQYGKHIAAAHKMHKSLCDSAKKFYIPIDEAVQIIDKGIGAFATEQKRLKELADQQAREEQEAAQKKIMDAATAKINKALASTGKIEQQIIDMQAIVDNADSSETEIELASRQIEVLRMKLDTHTEKAAQIQKTAEQAVDALPVASPASVSYQKTAGVKVKKIGEVINKTALIKAVAEGKIPDVVFDINQGHINRLINMGIVFPTDAVIVKKEAKYGGRG